MPVMDGFETCKIMRKMIQEGKLEPLYIIAVTAGLSDEQLSRCEEVGFDEILMKPISNDVLKNILHKYLPD